MAENNLLPIAESQPQDIFICGFPRSGHTWFQNLTAGAVFGFDPEFAHDTLIQDLVPDAQYKSYYKRYGQTAYFKTHLLPDPRIRRVVYLLRDGRDAMTSYYHFLQALQGTVDFLNLVQTEQISPCPWQDHVTAWLDNPYGADQLVVRYEDLHTNPLRELERFCEFAGLSRDQEHLSRVILKAGFGLARKKEQTQGWENPAWPKDKAFIRRGQIGSYRDEMPDEVQQAFLTRAAPTLARCGYIDAPIGKAA